MRANSTTMNTNKKEANKLARSIMAGNVKVKASYPFLMQAYLCPGLLDWTPGAQKNNVRFNPDSYHIAPFHIGDSDSKLLSADRRME